MEDRLQQAIELAQAGERAEARAILRQLVKEQPNLESAWLWLASTAETQAERVDALVTVLALNPNNKQARTALRQLGHDVPETQPKPPTPSETPPSESRLNPLEIAGIAVFVVIAVIVVFFVGGEIRERNAATNTPTSTATRRPTITLTPSITNTPGPSPTPIIQPTLPPTWTPIPTSTPRPTRTPIPTDTLVPSRTPLPSLTPTRTPSNTPTETLTDTPAPTDTPSDTPEPTDTPTRRPSRTPTDTAEGA